MTPHDQESDLDAASKSIEAKLPLWSKAYDLPLELLTGVRELHANAATSGASEFVPLLQEMMSIAVAAVEQNAARLSKLFLSQELRCLTGLLPVGTMHYYQNMVPSNSHVLAVIEPSDLPAFEVAFKVQQAEDRPAGILGTSAPCKSTFTPTSRSFLGQSAPADPPELAEAVTNAIGPHGLPLPHSPSSAGFLYRNDCRSNATFARHVMFQEDIADAINGVRYGFDALSPWICILLRVISHLQSHPRVSTHRCNVASEHELSRFSFRPSRCGRGLSAEMFADVPESDEVSGAFELRSEIKAAMKQVADCLAALEQKKT